MPLTNRQAKIDSYGQAYAKLDAALQRYPKEMWHFRPAPDLWTIHEIVVHITDSEANSYIRCRRLIAENGAPLIAYDENRWARELAYHQQDTALTLELFRWLRQASLELIRTLPESVWAHQAHHPENGTITLDDWLDTYERHIPEHIAQMDRVYQSWQEQQTDH